jgi:heptosyltransferase-2
MERFAVIGDWATEHWGAKVIVMGSRREEEICGSVTGSMRNTSLNMCGKTTLGEAMALIKRCKFFVSNDSGLMHVAAALGRPMIAIFGSTDPVKTGPLSQRANIVKLDVDCAPCFKPVCPLDYRCMLGIEPDRVWREMEIMRACLKTV